MFLNKDNMVYVDKSWGNELWICNNEKYCGKILNIKKDHLIKKNNKYQLVFIT